MKQGIALTLVVCKGYLIHGDAAALNFQLFVAFIDQCRRRFEDFYHLVSIANNTIVTAHDAIHVPQLVRHAACIRYD